MAGTDNAGMTAILLVAGVGRRLGREDTRPKVLLEFGGKTLLERHFQALRANGVNRYQLTVGHGKESIRREVERLGLTGQVEFVDNARYREGSLLSLWQQSRTLRNGHPVLLMDGDVLYGETMIARLLSAPSENVLLVDRHIAPGDEPVKICFRAEQIVDFRKKPEHDHDWHGESVGFFRFSGAAAASLADRCDAYVEQNITDIEYEEAIRDLILAAPGRFSAIDISDLPWTEIDFEEDVLRAQNSIMPRLNS